MRISDWSSDVCSSDLAHEPAAEFNGEFACLQYRWPLLQCFMERRTDFFDVQRHVARKIGNTEATAQINERRASVCFLGQSCGKPQRRTLRSEEHTSELQSLMRNSYAVVRLKK